MSKEYITPWYAPDLPFMPQRYEVVQPKRVKPANGDRKARVWVWHEGKFPYYQREQGWVAVRSLTTTGEDE